MPGNFSAWSYPHSGSASAAAAGLTLSRSSERQKLIVTVPSRSDTLGGKKEIVPIKGEWIGDNTNGKHRAESMKLTIAD